MRLRRSLRFVFTGPVLIILLFALGLKMLALMFTAFWLLAVLRVMRAALLVGGLAGVAAYLNRR
jgi:hypothetical protein